MRAAVLGFSVLTAVAASAHSAPLAVGLTSPPRLVMPSTAITAVRRDGDPSPTLGALPSYRNDTSAPALSFEPAPADFHPIGFGRKRRAEFAHYRLDGIHVLGGSLGGSIDGRGATLSLRWPTAP